MNVWNKIICLLGLCFTLPLWSLSPLERIWKPFEWVKEKGSELIYGADNLDSVQAQEIQQTPDSSQHSIETKKQSDSCDIKQLGAFSIAEWYNAAELVGFLSETKKSVLNHPKCFVHINSPQNVTAWIAPFGFYNRYQNTFEDHQRIQFRQATLGFGSGFEFNPIDPIVMGVEAGYFHTLIHWKDVDGKGRNNAIFVGPYLSALFSQGYLEGALFGIGNFYDGKLKFCSSTSSDIGHMSWNLGGKIEGGLDLEIPSSFSPNLSLHPAIQIDYLNVFESGYQRVRKRTSSYLHTILSLRLSKVLFCTKSFFILPSLKTGWANWVFLSSQSVKVKGLGSCQVKGERKNQLLLGISILGVQANTIVFGLNYESLVGSKAPVHFGNLRAEWSW